MALVLSDRNLPADTATEHATVRVDTVLRVLGARPGGRSPAVGRVSVTQISNYALMTAYAPNVTAASLCTCTMSG